VAKAAAPAARVRHRRSAKDPDLPECTSNELDAIVQMLSGSSGPIRLDASRRDGRGVFATAAMGKGDFVCEYRGVVITEDEVLTREEAYERRQWGSFILLFQDEGRWHAVDATAERPEYGLARYINHSAKRANLRLWCVVIGGVPRIALLSKHEIKEGDELLFDYGDREKSVLEQNPWLEQ